MRERLQTSSVTFPLRAREQNLSNPPRRAKECCLSSALCSLLTLTAAPRSLLEMKAGSPFGP